MRWSAFFIFAYVMLGLQIGVSRYMIWHGAAPNFALIAVLFVSLHARRDAALLGSFALGLMQDLLTAQQLGLFAFTYGLIAVGVLATDQLVNRGHPLTHFTLALIAGFVLTMVLLIHSAIHPAGASMSEGKTVLGPLRISAATEFARMFYTAIVAPLVLLGLRRTHKLFAFQPGRRGGRG